eukprot:4633761-Amphidinium_carterae.1
MPGTFSMLTLQFCRALHFLQSSPGCVPGADDLVLFYDVATAQHVHHASGVLRFPKRPEPQSCLDAHRAIAAL